MSGVSLLPSQDEQALLVCTEQRSSNIKSRLLVGMVESPCV